MRVFGSGVRWSRGPALGDRAFRHGTTAQTIGLRIVGLKWLKPDVSRMGRVAGTATRHHRLGWRTIRHRGGVAKVPRVRRPHARASQLRGSR